MYFFLRLGDRRFRVSCLQYLFRKPLFSWFSAFLYIFLRNKNVLSFLQKRSAIQQIIYYHIKAKLSNFPYTSDPSAYPVLMAAEFLLLKTALPSTCESLLLLMLHIIHFQHNQAESDIQSLSLLSHKKAKDSRLKSISQESVLILFYAFCNNSC